MIWSLVTILIEVAVVVGLAVLFLTMLVLRARAVSLNFPWKRILMWTALILGGLSGVVIAWLLWTPVWGSVLKGGWVPRTVDTWLWPVLAGTVVVFVIGKALGKTKVGGYEVGTLTQKVASSFGVIAIVIAALQYMYFDVPFTTPGPQVASKPAAVRQAVETCSAFKNIERQVCAFGDTIVWTKVSTSSHVCLDPLPKNGSYTFWYKSADGGGPRIWAPGSKGSVQAVGFQAPRGTRKAVSYWQSPSLAGCD